MDNNLKDFLINELKNRYNCEVEFENNCVVAVKASKPNAPIHPEDIINILKRAAQKFSELGGHDLAYSIDKDGSVRVGRSFN